MKAIAGNPGTLAEIERLTREHRNASTDEEREEIGKKLQTVTGDMLKDLMPDLKKILIKGHADFHRILTEVQKFKIRAIMADMPDSMKKRIDEANKEGGLSAWDSWVSGIGVPGVNPNREAQRQRNERTFPGF